MRIRRDGFPASLLVTAIVVVWAAAIGLAATSARATVDQPSSSPTARPAHSAPAAPTAQATGFVGDDTCATCHETEAKSLHASLHGKAQNTRTPAAQSGRACETCHGPGQKHVDSGKKEDIRRFDAMRARDVNASCLSCHTKGSHAAFQGSMHDARNVSCATCNNVHAPKTERAP